MSKKRMLVKRILKDERISFVVTTPQKKFMIVQAEKKEMSLAEYVRKTVLQDMPKK